MSCAPMWGSINSFISRVPLFAGLNPDELEEIARDSRKIIAARGDLLFRKGEACHGLHVIVFGQVKLFFSSALGNEKILDVFAQRDTLDESTLFQGGNYQLFAQTLNECVLLHIGRDVLLEILNSNRAFAHRVIDKLAKNVFGLMQSVESFSLQSGRQRVINYLAREALRANPALRDHFGQNAWSAVGEFEPVSLVIHLPTSKGIIASCLNITQEHLSRILHELSADGVLAVVGRDIHIDNLAQFWQNVCQTELPPENEHREYPLLTDSAKPSLRQAVARLAAARAVHVVA